MDLVVLGESHLGLLLIGDDGHAGSRGDVGEDVRVEVRHFGDGSILLVEVDPETLCLNLDLVRDCLGEIAHDVLIEGLLSVVVQGVGVRLSPILALKGIKDEKHLDREGFISCGKLLRAFSLQNAFVSVHKEVISN